MANLSFGILLAPYRVDYYNYLHDEFNFEIYFRQKGFHGQLFSTEDVVEKCSYKPKYMTIKWIGKYSFATGLYRIIKRNRPKVIIVPEFSLIAIQVILIKFIFGCKYKIVSQCDDSYDMLTGGKNFSFFHKIARRVCLPFLSDLILVDKKATEWYQANYNKGQWVPIIQNENCFFRNCDVIEDSSKIFREQYNLRSKLSILFVARHIALKNFPTLLHACKEFPQPYQIIVVGDGEMRVQWEQLANQMGINALFLGQKNGNELYSIYKACDIFVLPSFIEAFGAVTNEALLNGCICVISKNAGSACLIDEGINGFLFNPNSADELFRVLLKAAELAKTNDKKNKMSISFPEIMNNAFNNILK